MAKNKKNVKSYYLLFGMIIVSLIVLLFIFDQPFKTSGFDGTYSNDSLSSDSSSFQSSISSKSYSSAAESSSSSAEETVVQKKGDLYFIIDDLGNNEKNLDRFLSVPLPLTYAIMPRRPYSSSTAEKILNSGMEIMIHQPMEALDGSDPGVAAVTTAMSDQQIQEVITENILSLPGAIGMNNHMGSRVTSDLRAMMAVEKTLKHYKMFFLDSVTTGKTVAGDVAAALELPYIKRNSLFLDNSNDKKEIIRMIYEGLNIAEKDGFAVMIGHFTTENLPEVLTDMAKDLDKMGYRVLPISQLIKEL